MKMKIGSVPISVLIIAVLPSIIILGLFYLLKPNNSEINKELKRLKQENELLQKKNDSIFYVVKGIESLKLKADERISQLELQEDKKEKEIAELNGKIKLIKNKYEKANNHAANYTSVDIQRYFADSLR